MPKATHNGTCQVCGRVQAVGVNSGNLAKHGYTVQWNFFSGTCEGADRAPMEKARGYCDATRQRLLDTAAAYESMTAEDVKSVSIEHKRPGGYERTTTVFHSADELQPFIDENPTYSLYTWDRMVEAVLIQRRTEAAQMRIHEKFLRELADERHGQDLIPRETKVEGEKVRFPAIRTRREALLKKAELEATGEFARVTVRQERGMYSFAITATRKVA